MYQHVVQSQEWGSFKAKVGTKVVNVGRTQFTVHKIPFTNYTYAYCPKVDPFSINFSDLSDALIAENCVAINFDVPNVLKNSEFEGQALEIFQKHNCAKSPKDTFAKFNVLLHLGASEEELLAKMHHKHRYNIKHAQSLGVTVKQGSEQKDFDDFYKLLSETAARQKYYIHSKSYYENIWQEFSPKGLCYILSAYYQGEILSSWMLFVYDNVLYYPYGGSSETQRNLHASNLVAWEAIKLGKSLGCHVFDMWGAAKDPNDTSDPWYGFTNFKLKFGGDYVEYIDSYDLVLNPVMYKLFNTANDLRWKILRLIK